MKNFPHHARDRGDGEVGIVGGVGIVVGVVTFGTPPLFPPPAPSVVFDVEVGEMLLTFPKMIVPSFFTIMIRPN